MLSSLTSPRSSTPLGVRGAAVLFLLAWTGTLPLAMIRSAMDEVNTLALRIAYTIQLYRVY